MISVKSSNFFQHCRKPLLVLLAFIAYYLTARLGLEVATINKQVSPVWPATGVAMSLIILFGPRMAIGIFAGAFLSNYQTRLNIPATVAISIGNTLESLFFVLVFARTISKNLFDVHNKAILGIFILILSAAISASVGTIALWITSAIPTSVILQNWMTWWIGDFLGALFIVPIAYKFKLQKFDSYKLTHFQKVKLLLVAVSVVVINEFIFSSDSGKAFLFLTFIPIFLGSLWFDSAWVYIVSLSICIFSVSSTVEGKEFFVGTQLNDSLIHLQIFLAGLGITTIGIGSLKQEGFHYKSNVTLLSGWILAGTAFYFSYMTSVTQDGNHFESKTGFVSSSIGFFGTLASLFLAIMLSSVQNLKAKAQQIADVLTEELREKKRNWKMLTETSPVGIFLTDRNGDCTYVNPAWTKMTGLLPKDAFQQGWTKALHPDDTPLVIKNWNKLISGGTFSCDYRYIKPDGSIVYVIGQALPLIDDKQKIIGYFGTVQNITEQYLNQIAVVTSSRMASLGQMASGIAHEINNPLMIIQGKALYLEKIIDPDGTVDFKKAKNTIDQISTTIQRIAKIIRGLQSFSRDTSEDHFQKSQIKNVIEITLELCQERFSKNDVNLILSNVIASNLMFLGSSEQISQVLLNLLNNAFDATIGQAEKWVKIEVEINRNENKLLVFVIDSGTGVPLSIQTKIFEPFFTTKEVGSGTGLGLSISKGIVAKHQGRLFIDNTKTHTTFVIELPLL